MIRRHPDAIAILFILMVLPVITLFAGGNARAVIHDGLHFRRGQMQFQRDQFRLERDRFREEMRRNFRFRTL